MTTDLREELAGLAGQQRPGSPPPDLWRRGVRRRRRTRAVAAGATVAAVAAGTLLTTVGLDVLRTDGPHPADGSGVAAIPDRLHTPDTRTDGTEGRPFGPLAVVAGAERTTGWWRGSSENGTVAVSATTGEYRFLDLPGQLEGSDEWFGDEGDPVLSPDGRTVAYWLRHPDDPAWVGGYAAYDAVTGEVVRHEVPSRLGLAPETMAWAGDDALVLQYGLIDDRDGDGGWGSVAQPPVLWRPGGDSLTELTGRRGWISTVSPTGSGFAAVTARGLELRDELEARPDRVLRVTGERGAAASTVSPDADTMVMLQQGRTGMVRRLLVGQVGAGPVVGLEPLPLEVEAFELVGWQGPGHVVVRGVADRRQRYADVYAVDVRTGRHELLVHEDRINWSGYPRYATALWSRPTVSRPAPEDEADPRLLVAGGAVLALAGAWGFRRWRRGRA
jgi:hypothetical protein